eukprot:SAG11_NODE_6773_length_1251_cov_1.450521_2_plen_174_part_00
MVAGSPQYHLDPIDFGRRMAMESSNEGASNAIFDESGAGRFSAFSLFIEHPPFLHFIPLQCLPHEEPPRTDPTCPRLICQGTLLFTQRCWGSRSSTSRPRSLCDCWAKLRQTNALSDLHCIRYERLRSARSAARRPELPRSFIPKTPADLAHKGLWCQASGPAYNLYMCALHA